MIVNPIIEKTVPEIELESTSANYVYVRSGSFLGVNEIRTLNLNPAVRPNGADHQWGEGPTRVAVGWTR